MPAAPAIALVLYCRCPAAAVLLLLLLLLLLLQTSMPAWAFPGNNSGSAGAATVHLQQGVATPLLAEAAAVQQEPSTVMELAVQV